MRFGVICLVVAGAFAFSTGCPGHPDLLAQIDQLGQRLQSEPANASLLLKRGDLYRRHEDYDSAAADFRNAREAEPGHELLDFYEGRLLHETGNQEQARVLVSRYLDRHPEEAVAWTLLGHIERRSGNMHAAADAFENAIRMSKSPGPDLFRLQILALASLGPEQHPFAYSVIDEGLRRFGIEVTLIGLGTDLALADGNAVRAAAYLGRLPERLMTLQNWKDRDALRACLESEPAQIARGCRQSAQNSLMDLTLGYPVN